MQGLRAAVAVMMRNDIKNPLTVHTNIIIPPILNTVQIKLVESKLAITIGKAYIHTFNLSLHP